MATGVSIAFCVYFIVGLLLLFFINGISHLRETIFNHIDNAEIGDDNKEKIISSVQTISETLLIVKVRAESPKFFATFILFWLPMLIFPKKFIR